MSGKNPELEIFNEAESIFNFSMQASSPLLDAGEVYRQRQRKLSDGTTILMEKTRSTDAPYIPGEVDMLGIHVYRAKDERSAAALFYLTQKGLHSISFSPIRIQIGDTAADDFRLHVEINWYGSNLPRSSAAGFRAGAASLVKWVTSMIAEDRYLESPISIRF